jgi:hypothetical protein
MATYISLLAIYLGALIFGTAVVAPLAVSSLDGAAAAAFLRRYWVVYHRFAVLGGLAFATIAALGSTASAVPLRYSFLLVCLAGLMTICFYLAMSLIQSINQAKDNEDHQRFNRLHRLNVSFVSLGMIVAALLLAALIYVLPGQFTFWPTAGE